MTFLANVLTKDDKNNSYVGVSTNSFIGTPTDTTGYNSLIVNINTNTDSTSGGLEIKFSSTGTDFDSSGTIFYRDTVFGTSSNSPNTFIKSYPILKQYYIIKYTSSASSNLKITSRLSTQSYTNNQNSISTFDNDKENIIDAFGKLRVSNPQTLIDLRVPGQDVTGIGNTGATGYRTNEIQICSNFTGSGVGVTGYKICTNSQTDIYVDGSGTFTNQSRKYCVYQPGKSLLIMMSGIMDMSGNNTVGTKSRCGYFDNYNGLYFEYTSLGGGTGECSVNILKKGSLSNTILQSDWNIDKMDGYGISGLRLDFTKAQLFVIDLEWLGVGRVRYGFYAYGKIQYCHQISQINTITGGPYTFNINLPVRYQLIGINGGTCAMIQICSTVISEGGYSPLGRPFSVSRVSQVSLTSSTNNYLLFLRGGNSYGNYYHQQILPTDLTFASSSVGDIGILTLKMYLPPVTEVTPIIWNDVNTNYSVCQYGTTGSVSDASGITLYQTVISGRGSINFGDLGQTFNDVMQITSNVSNQSSIIAIIVNGSFGGSSKGYCTISWSEIY